MYTLNNLVVFWNHYKSQKFFSSVKDHFCTGASEFTSQNYRTMDTTSKGDHEEVKDHVSNGHADAKRSAPQDSSGEEIKRQKPNVPEGMSKREWKRQMKKQKREETKDEYRQKKKEKRKQARERRKERIREEGDANSNADSDEARNHHQQKRIKYNYEEQKKTGVRILMDCGFDDLMNEREIVSLSCQIARAYSAQRHCKHHLQLDITPFNKRLKQRFDEAIPQYNKWSTVNFIEGDSLENALPMDDPESMKKITYLTADTDNEIEELEAGHTYIIGGIVDKNRHKNLCADKAKELGINTARLPIGKYIKINGRLVLATSHVFELCCQWFETNHDWAEAFNAVLPPRKLHAASQTSLAQPETSEEATDLS